MATVLAAGLMIGACLCSRRLRRNMQGVWHCCARCIHDPDLVLVGTQQRKSMGKLGFEPACHQDWMVANLLTWIDA